jgi:Fe-S cluster assembly scaffold IscU
MTDNNNPYSEKVLEFVENPKNVGSLNENDEDVGTGVVGSPVCGDIFKIQIKIDEKTREIIDVKFRTYGCCAAIASACLATEWLKGKTIEEAEEITDKAIAKELELPPIKVHCSCLAEDGIMSALKNWRSKHQSISDTEQSEGK